MENTLLTLANLTKSAKSYALDTSLSDEVFLNAFLDPLVTTGRVKARGGIPFHLDKSRTSQILNGKCDVPGALRKPLARYEIKHSVADEYDAFIDEYIDAKAFSSLAEDILTHVQETSEAKQQLRGSLDNPSLFLAIALMEAIKNDNRDSLIEPVWSNGTGSLSIEVGNLLSHGFGKPRFVKQIVVIPVDTTFETRVTWEYENSALPLISPKTLHGQWLSRMSAAGISSDELDDRIESYLRRRGIEPISTREIESRIRHEYPVGTIAIIENARSLFYLLAIARLDAQHNTYATHDDIANSIQALIHTYDKMGQGLDIYIPLLGTGKSRANLTHKKSLDLITNELTSNKTRIHGKVTIVVLKDDVKRIGA